MRVACVLVVAMAGAAHADEKLVPVSVAVSSTVDNAKILPRHLVDGSLATAWNSVTNDKAPWIMVRVPAGAHVTAIKVTAGFSAIDKKLGDLFTQNYRIDRVRISRNGTPLGDFPLDIEQRDLQTLKLDAAGGDFKIEITRTVAGSKKDWKEIAVSELEVWGDPDPAAPPAKVSAPPVAIGSLDNYPALTKAECSRVLGTPDDPVVAHAEIGITGALTVCRRDTRPKDSVTTTVQIVLADRRTRKLLARLPDITVDDGEYTDTFEYSSCSQGCTKVGNVALELPALTATETVLAVSVERGEDTFHSTTSTVTTTWYRASTTGLAQVLEYSSHNSGDEHDSTGLRCELVAFVPTATPPKQLELECHKWKEGIYERNPVDRTKTRRYKWNGSAYTKP